MARSIFIGVMNGEIITIWFYKLTKREIMRDKKKGKKGSPRDRESESLKEEQKTQRHKSGIRRTRFVSALSRNPKRNS